jgi:hypothetical protein
VLLGRILGWLLIAVALLALGGDGLRWLETGMVQFIALGDFWARLDPPTWALLQTIGRDYLPPVLWDPGLATILRWPAVRCWAYSVRRCCCCSAGARRSGASVSAPSARRRTGKPGATAAWPVPPP